MATIFETASGWYRKGPKGLEWAQPAAAGTVHWFPFYPKDFTELVRLDAYFGTDYAARRAESLTRRRYHRGAYTYRVKVTDVGLLLQRSSGTIVHYGRDGIGAEAATWVSVATTTKALIALEPDVLAAIAREFDVVFAG